MKCILEEASKEDRHGANDKDETGDIRYAYITSVGEVISVAKWLLCDQTTTT